VTEVTDSFIACIVASDCSVDCSTAIAASGIFKLIAYPICHIPSRNLTSSQRDDMSSNCVVLPLGKEKRCLMKKSDMFELGIICCSFSTNPIHARLS